MKHKPEYEITKTRYDVEREKIINKGRSDVMRLMSCFGKFRKDDRPLSLTNAYN